jgi:phosphatidylinositol N-acetylglucosaminyltransferase subunit C
VSWGSAGTVLGWVLWDWWVGREEATNSAGDVNGEGDDAGSSASSTTGSVHGTRNKETNGVAQGLGLKLSTTLPNNQQRPGHSHSASATSVHSNASASSPVSSPYGNGPATFGQPGFHSQYGTSSSMFSPRNQQRLATAKSALLIYCALLGLSPILKSLTRSTTSDSIWAMSAWLLCINVFFFDYSGDVK